MQTFILIHTTVGAADEVARRIATSLDVVSAEAVTGPYDVIVRTDTETSDEVTLGIVPEINEINGVTRTITCPVAAGRRVLVG